jgi:hypothetical protein
MRRMGWFALEPPAALFAGWRRKEEEEVANDDVGCRQTYRPGGPSYINADQVAYVMTTNQTCRVFFAGAKEHCIEIEGDADKIVNSMGGPAFDATRA